VYFEIPSFYTAPYQDGYQKAVMHATQITQPVTISVWAVCKKVQLARLPYCQDLSK